MNRQLQPVRCRRCQRPLGSHLSTRAGLGAKCAQYEAVDAAQEPQGAVVAPAGGLPGPDPASAAVAAVAAALHGLPVDVLDGILADAGTDGARILAGLLAFAIRETDGGPEWLARVALDWARAEVV